MPEKGEPSVPFDRVQRVPNGRARAAALAVVANAAYNPTAVVSFLSGGRLLAIGSGERLHKTVSCLGPRMESLILLLPPGEAASDSIPSSGRGSGNVVAFNAIPKSISGYLGKFSVILQGPKGEIGLDALTANTETCIDLVLDLSVPSVIAGKTYPHGYFAPGDNTEAFERALAEIPELVGEFQQPQYVRYDPDICAHARSGIEACTRCLDACSSGSIRGDGDRIQVDPHLCQGAGSCATACPTGALRYAYPSSSDLLETLKAMLRAYRNAGGREPPVLLFHDGGDGREQVERVASRMPDCVIPMQMEEVGSAGIEVWLAALAYGAARVLVLGSVQTTAAAREEIERQLSYAAALLQTLGYPPEGLGFVSGTGEDCLRGVLQDDKGRGLEIEPATFAAFDEKRTMIRLALDHLHRHAPQPRPLALLPTGAPFGEVWLNAESCTLCMACVSQCPGGALQAGDELPQLKFVEDSCVQCGLCARSCPENAIGPSPRYLFDQEQRRRIRVLKEEEPFRCILCGKPFATRSIIGNIMLRLQGTPMGGPDRMRLLKMCEDCRVRATHEQELQTFARHTEDSP